MKNGTVIAVTDSRGDVQARHCQVAYEVIENTCNRKGRQLLGGCSPEREVTSANNM